MSTNLRIRSTDSVAYVELRAAQADDAEGRVLVLAAQNGRRWQAMKDAVQGLAEIATRADDAEFVHARAAELMLVLAAANEIRSTDPPPNLAPVKGGVRVEDR